MGDDDLDEALAVRERDRLRAAVYLELVQDALDINNQLAFDP